MTEGAVVSTPAVGQLPPLTPQSRVVLAKLSVVEQNGGFIVGNLDSGVFVELPEIGVRVIERLQVGCTIAEVADAVSGGGEEEAVDVVDFAQTLAELGFVTGVDGVERARTERARGWVRAPRARWIDWLFSPFAWAFYAALSVGCVAVLLLAPQYRPRSTDYFFLPDPVASLAALTLLSFVLTATHEIFHWLAAGVQGIPARFSIGRRLYFLVFETDLTLLWSVPVGRRYAPLLAGMAFDVLTLAAALAVRMLAHAGVMHPPTVVVNLAAAIGVMAVFKLVWQFCVFMRNDLYAVLAIRLGCVNLWRTTMLTLKRTLWRLSPAEAEELDAAHPRDVRHARWYRWVCAGGVVLAAWFAAVVPIPALWYVVGWIGRQLAEPSIANLRFWEALVFGVLALLPQALPLGILVRDVVNRRRAARPPLHPGDTTTGADRRVR